MATLRKKLMKLSSTNKICVCWVIVGELESGFSKLQGFQCYFPGNFRCNNLLRKLWFSDSSFHHIFESEKFRFLFFLWKITQPGELFIKKGTKTETVTVLTESLTLQFVDGVDRGALGILVPINFKNGAWTGAHINTENTFERVRLLERGRFIESLRCLLMVRKANLYEVHCINSRLSREILRWPSSVKFDHFFSVNPKNYNYETNLQVAFSEQLSETPLESQLRFKNAVGSRLPPFHFHLHCFPWS